MKTDKVERILRLYHRLMHGQHVNKAVFCFEHEIDGRSFDRDVQDIRLFLSEIYDPRELHFDKVRNVYYLRGQTLSQMDVADATVLGKLLLQSGLFRRDEAEGLLAALSATVGAQDLAKLKTATKQDLRQYHSAPHNKPIVKILNDLTSVITHQNQIKLTLDRDGKKDVVEVAPMELLFDPPRIYLCAFDPASPDRTVLYPVDEIHSFEILPGTYPYKLKQKYISIKEANT